MFATFAPINKPADLRIIDKSFSATQVTVEPVSARGLEFFQDMFGACCVSVDLAKSTALHFAAFAAQKGFVVED